MADALHAFGCYDQVNLGGLLGIEILCRRITALVDAYDNPAKPNFVNARYFEGSQRSSDIVAPALRTHVLRCAKDDVEVLNSQTRAAAARGPAGTGPGQDEGHGDGLGVRSDGKGRGRARGGRGARAAPPGCA